jgi:hypothetical protein
MSNHDQRPVFYEGWWMYTLADLAIGARQQHVYCSKITPIVLRTSGIDVILGIDWMKQNQTVIQCPQKVVVVNAPNGEKISVDVAVQKQLTALVNQLDDDASKENPVIDEFPDIFSDDLSGMPPDRDVEFIT